MFIYIIWLFPVCNWVTTCFFKIFLGNLNFLQVFKTMHFWVYFQLKAKFKVKNYVKQYKNIEKILKSYFYCVFQEKNVLLVAFIVFVLLKTVESTFFQTISLITVSVIQSNTVLLKIKLEKNLIKVFSGMFYCFKCCKNVYKDFYQLNLKFIMY